MASYKYDIFFSFGAIDDKLISLCPSNNMTELLSKVRGRVLMAELREIVRLYTHDTHLTNMA